MGDGGSLDGPWPALQLDLATAGLEPSVAHLQEHGCSFGDLAIVGDEHDVHPSLFAISRTSPRMWLLIQLTGVLIASPAAGNWIAIAVFGIVIVLLIAPVVWLSWRFLQMSDEAFIDSVNDVQEFVDLTVEARTEAKSLYSWFVAR